MLQFERIFTGPDKDPFNMVKWEEELITVKNREGEIIYTCANAQFPEKWSKNARKITAQKYFRTSHKTNDRETSVASMVERVAKTIALSGVNQGYFDPAESINFEAELSYVLLNQMASFNSPVWFNLGVPGNDKPQTSACFINEVKDNMESILDLCAIEGMIFKEGSGSGVNFSSLRGSREKIKGGGQASGPLSFMQGYDAFANVILSGGRVRRAARMCVLDIDHPDIEGFITCKAEQEDIVEILVKAGIPADFTAEKNAYTMVKHQSANNSVRVTDKFMEAVRKSLYYGEDSDWELVNRVDGEKTTVPVSELFHKIAEAAHKCGDPGLQFGDTINRMNTCGADGEIVSSNPCFAGDMRILTETGYMKFSDLENKVIKIISPVDGKKYESKVWCSGTKEVYEVRFANPKYKPLKCTANHVFKLHDQEGECRAIDLPGKRIAPYLFKDLNDPHNKRIIDDLPPVSEVAFIGLERVYDFTEPEHHWGVVQGFIAHNCGEYLALNNSACNLSSLNLCKFIKDDRFDFKTFKHVIRLMLTAQDILINLSSYPTKKIQKNSHQYRPLGLGYANLGGMLMSLGLPYDSDSGRHLAAAITSLLTGNAFLTSIELAEVVGVFERYPENRSHMLNVLEQQYAWTKQLVPDTLGAFEQAQATWKDVMGIGFGKRKSIEGTGPGFRNSQVTLLAPTGTISFMMDCSTTGIEPDVGLKKIKSMVGGNTMEWINDNIEPALTRLGYNQKEKETLLKYVQQNGHFEGSTLKEEHLPVFDCALPVGTRQLSVDGHLNMVAAVQPFLSGGISKTFNMPNEATVRDVEHTFVKAWENKLKGITIYRSGSKLSEPLRVKEVTATKELSEIRRKKRTPADLQSFRHKFTISGNEGFIHPAFDPETGELVELFIRVAKAGSTVYGLLDSFAIMFSKALQYGAPLEELITHMEGSKFEPYGVTSHPDIVLTSSILDYIARWLRLNYLPKDTEENGHGNGNGYLDSMPPPAPTQDALSESPCPNCGQLLRRTGTCKICTNCAFSSGVCG